MLDAMIKIYTPCKFQWGETHVTFGIKLTFNDHYPPLNVCEACSTYSTRSFIVPQALRNGEH
jgi:hypothetical protein